MYIKKGVPFYSRQTTVKTKSIRTRIRPNEHLVCNRNYLYDDLALQR
jgi:hypothetical protein